MKAKILRGRKRWLYLTPIVLVIISALVFNFIYSSSQQERTDLLFNDVRWSVEELSRTVEGSDNRNYYVKQFMTNLDRRYNMFGTVYNNQLMLVTPRFVDDTSVDFDPFISDDFQAAVMAYSAGEMTMQYRKGENIRLYYRWVPLEKDGESVLAVAGVLPRASGEVGIWYAYTVIATLSATLIGGVIMIGYVLSLDSRYRKKIADAR